MMIRRLVPFLLIACVLASTVPAASALTSSEIETRIQEILAQRHPVDTPETWKSLGPSAVDVIIAMLGQTTHSYHRIRLVEALAWFPESARALEYLKKTATDTDEGLVRNAAVRSVGHSQGARELEFLSKFLTHSDVQTRFATAQTLKLIADRGEAPARARLDEYLKNEKVKWVATRLQGGFPKPTATLEVTGSSEDRLSPSWEGTWTGYWLVPSSKSAGITAVPVKLELRADGAFALAGTLKTIPKKGQSVAFELKEVKGKSARVTGLLPAALERLTHPSSQRELPVQFEAEYREEASSSLIELRAGALGGRLLARKAPQ